MRLTFAIKHRVVKKISAIVFAVIYIHVNIVFAAVPTLPLGSSVSQLAKSTTFSVSPFAAADKGFLSILISMFHRRERLLKEIVVFHAPLPYEQPYMPPPETKKDVQEIEKAERPKERVVPQQRVHRVSELPEGRVKEALKARLGEDGILRNVTVKDILSSGVPLTKEQKAELTRLFGQDKNATIAVVKETQTGMVHFQIRGLSNAATVSVDQKKGTSDIQSRTLPGAAPQTQKKQEVPQPGARIGAQRLIDRLHLPRNPQHNNNRQQTPQTPQQQQRQGQNDLRNAIRNERARAGDIITVGGQQVRLKMDEKTKQLIPVDVKTGQRITNAVFTTQVKDARGQLVTVNYSIHHFEMQGDQLVAKGAMQVQAGQQFRDGQIGGDQGTAGPQRETGGLASHGLDVTVNRGGQILFEGKAGGGEVAFTAPVTGSVTENGKVDMGAMEYQPVTAGSYDITVKNNSGQVVAEAGAQGNWDAGKGNEFRFSNWTVNQNAAGTAEGKAILNHFNISENSSTLVDREGFAVGRVTLNESKQVVQIIGNNTEHGKDALTQIFFRNKQDFAAGGAHQNVEVGITGTEGRAVVFFNDKTTLANAVNVVERMETRTFKNVPRETIDNYFMGIAQANPGISRYEVTTQLQLKDKTYNIQVSGRGQNASGNVAIPRITSDSPDLADYLVVNRSVDNLSSVGIDIDAKVQPSDITYTVDPETGQTKFNKDGVLQFQNQNTGLTGTITIKNGVATEMTLNAGGSQPTVVDFGKNGNGAAHNQITIPAGQQVTANLQTGQLSGDLNGVEISSRDTGLTVRLQADAANPNVINPVITKDFTAFGQNVSQSNVTARFENGRVLIDLKSPVQINQTISLANPENTEKSLQLDNATIVQIGIDPVKGSLTGVGRSHLDHEILILNQPGSGAGVGSVTPEGADSQNLIVETLEKGTLVRPIGGDAYINVAITDNGNPGGPITGQANVMTSRATNIQTGDAGANLMGQHFSAGWRIDKTSDGNYQFKALTDGANYTVPLDNMTVTANEAGTTLTFENGQLQNNASLIHVSIKTELGTITFVPQSQNPEKVNPVLHGTASTSSFFGQMKSASDLESTTGRLEGGKIVFDLKSDRAIVSNSEVLFTGGNTEASSRRTEIHQIGFDVTTGAKFGIARTQIANGETLFVPGEPATGQAGNNADRLTNTIDTATQNVSIESKNGGMEVRGLGNDAWINTQVFDMGVANAPIIAQPNVVSDHASNLHVVGQGADVMGKHFDAGLVLNVEDPARGTFTVRAEQEGSVQLSKDSKITLSSGALAPFVNNQFDSANSKGGVTFQSQAPRLDESNPGLTLRGTFGPTEVTFQDGQVTSRKGNEYVNNSSEAAVIKDALGNTTTIAPGTRFTHFGTENFLMKENFQVKGNGQIEFRANLGRSEDGRTERSIVVQFQENQRNVLIEDKTTIGDSQQTRQFVSEIENLSGDRVVKRAEYDPETGGYKLTVDQGNAADRGTLQFGGLTYKLEGGRFNLDAGAPGSKQWVDTDVFFYGNRGQQVSLLDTNGEVLSGRLDPAKNDRGGEIFGQYNLVHTSDGKDSPQYLFTNNNGDSDHPSGIQRIGVSISENKITEQNMQAVDDSGGSHRFTLGDKGVVFAENYDQFTLDGNQVTVNEGNNGAQEIQTILSPENVSKRAIAINASGISVGTVRVMEGTAQLEGQGTASTQVQFDNSGVLGLELDGKDAEGNSVFVITSDQRPEGAKFVIDAGSRFVNDSKNSGRLRMVEGSLSARRAGDEIVISNNGEIGMFQGSGAAVDPNSDQPAPERVSIRYRGDDKKTIAVEIGRVFVQNGNLVLKPGTLMVNRDLNNVANYNNPRRLMVLQGNGGIHYAIMTLKDSTNKRAVAEDVRDTAKQMNFTSGDLAAGGAGEGDTNIAMDVVDRSGRVIGRWEVDRAKVINEVHSANAGVGGASYYEVATNQRSLAEGSFVGYERNFASKTVRLETITESGERKTITTTARSFVQDRFQDDGSGHMEHFEEKVEVAEGLEGRVIVVDRPGNENDEYVFVKNGTLTQVTSVSQDKTNPDPIYSGTFSGQDQSGQNIFMNIHAVFNDTLANSSNSDERKQEARQDQQVFASGVSEFINTGQFRTTSSQGSLDFIVSGKQRLAFGRYNQAEYEGRFTTVLYAIGSTALKLSIVGLFVDGEKIDDAIMSQAPAVLAMKQIDSDVAQLESGNIFTTLPSQLAAMKERDNSISWASVDRFAGSITGFNRIAELDSSQGGWFVAKFALCVGEQTLNYFTLGGAGLLKGGGAAAVQGTRAFIAASRAAKVAMALRAGAAGGRWALSTTLQLWMRSQAFDTFHSGVEGLRTGSMGAGEFGGTIAKGAGELVISEIYFLAKPFVSLISKSSALRPIATALGFGEKAAGTARAVQLGKQALTMGAAGALFGAGHAAVTSWSNGMSLADSLGSIGLGVLRGAAAGIVGLALYRATGAVASYVGRTAFVKGLEQTVQAIEGKSVTTGFKIQDALKLNSLKALFGIGTMGRNAITGAGAMVAYHGGNNVGQSMLQGSLIGVLAGGALRAIGNLKTAASNIPAPGGLVAFNMERIKAGVEMGVWEVVFNTQQFNGGWDWVNPLTWANGISQGLSQTGIMGPSSHLSTSGQGIFSTASLEKFGSTFAFIAKMHPFFAFGRPSQSLTSALMVDRVSARIGRMASNASKKSLVASSFLQVSNYLLQKAVIMPVNINVFTAFEQGSANLAQRTGLIDVEMRNGEMQGKTTADSVGLAIFRGMGFMNAPAQSHSRSEAYARETLKVFKESESEKPSFVRSVARELRAFREVHSAEIGRQIVNELGTRSEANAGDPVRFRGLDGQIYEISAGAARELLPNAAYHIAGDSRVQRPVMEDNSGNGVLQVAIGPEGGRVLRPVEGKHAMTREAAFEILRQSENGTLTPESLKAVLTNDAQKKGPEAKSPERSAVDSSSKDFVLTRVAEAREVLGLRRGERVVRVDTGLRSLVQARYVTSLDPVKDKSTLTNLAKNHESTNVRVLAVGRLHGSDAQAVFQARVSAGVQKADLDSIVDNGVKEKQAPNGAGDFFRRADGALVIDIGNLSEKSHLWTTLFAMPENATAKIIVTKSGQTLVEIRNKATAVNGTERVPGQRVVTFEINSPTIRTTRFEISGNQAHVTEMARRLGIPSDSAEMKFVAARSGAADVTTVRFDISRPVDSKNNGLGPVAKIVSVEAVKTTEEGPAYSNHTPQLSELQEAVRMKNELLEAPSSDTSKPVRVIDILRSDSTYRESAVAAIDKKIEILISGDTSKIELAKRENKQAVEGYRVLMDYETKTLEPKSKTDSARDTGKPSRADLNDTGLIKKVREARRELVEAARKNGPSMQSFRNLVEAMTIQTTVDGVEKLNRDKIKALEKRVSEKMPVTTDRQRAQKSAMERFIKVVNDHADNQGKDGFKPDESIKSIEDSLQDIFNAFELNLNKLDPVVDGEAPVSNKRLEALDTLLTSDSAEARADALSTLFNGKRSTRDLNAGEEMALFMTLSTRQFELINGVGNERTRTNPEYLKNRQSRAENSSMQAKQAALLTQFALGRIAGLAAGGGKTAVFTLGFGQFAAKNTNESAVGELIVYSPDEVAKYISEYQPLARAMGVEFVDGRGLYAKSDINEWRKAYDANVDRNGNEWASGQRLFKVVVLDYHSRGFIENKIRAERDSAPAELVKNVKVQGMDEADALLLSRMSFISSNGNAVASEASVKRGETLLDATLEALGYDRSESRDLNTNSTWRRYEGSAKEQAGYRDFSTSEGWNGEANPRSITKQDLQQGYWFHVSEKGDVIVSNELLSRVQEIAKARGLSDVEGVEVMQTLRALESSRNESRLVFEKDDKTGDDTLRPTLVSGGRPQKGQIDSSTIFNVVSVLLYNRANGSDSLSTKDIRLSEAGSMATFVQVLQTSVDHRFGATGTPESMKGLAQLVIGMKVVDVDPSNWDQYNVSEHSSGIDEIYDGTARARRDASGSRGVDKNVDILVRDSVLTDSQRGDVEARVLFRSQNERSEGAPRGAGILAAAGEAVHKRAVVEYLKMEAREKGLTSDAVKTYLEKAEKSSTDSTRTLRQFVEGLREGLPNELMGFVGKIKVIDGREDGEIVNKEIVNKAAAEGFIVLANESGLRALNYRANEGQQIDLFMAGFEGFSKEGWLQALARVDRGQSRGARRIILMEAPLLNAHLSEAVRVDTRMRQDGKSEGLFGDSKELTGLLNQYRETNGQGMSTSDKLKLASAYHSKDNQARSALFFIGEQASVQLLKQPLQDMIARERSAGNEKGANYLEGIYRDVLSHSDKGELSQGVEFQDFRKIGAQAFNNAAQQAARFLIVIAKEGGSKGVSSAIIQEARLRIGDIESAMEQVGDKFALGRAGTDKSGNPSFVQVSDSILGSSPAAKVLDVVVRLTDDFILPNTSLGKESAVARPQTQQMYSTQAQTRAGPSKDSKYAYVQSARRSVADALESSDNSFREAPTSKNRTLTAAGQKLAAASYALMDVADDEKTGAALASLGYTGPASHINQATFLSQFQDPKKALAMAVALHAAGVAMNAAQVSEILSSDDVRRDLAAALLDQNATGDSQGATNLLSTVVDASDQSLARNVQSKFLNVRTTNGGFKSTWSGVFQSLWQKITQPNPNNILDRLNETKISDVTPQTDNVEKDIGLAVLIGFILNPGMSAQTVIKSQDRLAEKFSNPEGIGNATVSDLVELATPEKSTSVDKANFDKAATDPARISASKWYMPALITGAAVVGVTVAALAIAASAGVAVPGVAALGFVSGGLSSFLGGSVGFLAAGLVAKPITELIFGKSTPLVPKGGSQLQNMKDSFMSKTGLTTMGISAALAYGVPFILGAPIAGATALTVGLAVGAAMLVNAILLKEASPRVKAGVVLSAAVLGGGISLVPPVAASLGVAASAIGSGIVSLLTGAVAGAVALGTGWLAVKGPAQALVNRATTVTGPTRDRALAVLRNSDQAKNVLSTIRERKENSTRALFERKGPLQDQLRELEAKKTKLEKEKSKDANPMAGYILDYQIQAKKKEITDQAKARGEGDLNAKSSVGEIIDQIDRDVENGKIKEEDRYDVLKQALIQEGASEERADEIVAKIKAGDKEDATDQEVADAETVKSMTVEELSDESTSLDLIIDLKQYENELQDQGQTLSVNAIEEHNWEGSEGQTPAQAKKDVYDHFFHRETTQRDRSALRQLSDYLRSYATSLNMPLSNLPSVREMAQALNEGNVTSLFSNLLSAARPNTGVAQAAKQLSSQRDGLLSGIKEELKAAGLGTAEIGRFMASVQMAPRFNESKFTKAINDALSDVNLNPQTLGALRNTIQNSFFNTLPLLIKGAQMKLSEGQMRLLVAAVSATGDSGNLTRQWDQKAPVYQAIGTLVPSENTVLSVVQTRKDTYEVNSQEVNSTGDVVTQPVGLVTRTGDRVELLLSEAPHPLVTWQISQPAVAAQPFGSLSVDLENGTALQVRRPEKADWEPLTPSVATNRQEIPANAQQFRIVTTAGDETRSLGPVFTNPQFTPAEKNDQKKAPEAAVQEDEKNRTVDTGETAVETEAGSLQPVSPAFSAKVDNLFVQVGVVDQANGTVASIDDPRTRVVWQSAIGLMKDPEFKGVPSLGFANGSVPEGANFGVGRDRRTIFVQGPAGEWRSFQVQGENGSARQLVYSPRVNGEMSGARMFRLPGSSNEDSSVTNSSIPEATDTNSPATPVTNAARSFVNSPSAKSLLILIAVGVVLANPSEAVAATLGSAASSALSSDLLIPAALATVFVAGSRGLMAGAFRQVSSVFSNIRERAQRSEQRSLRATGPNTVSVDVPTAQGPTQVTFQSESPFASTFFAQSGDTHERVFARTVDRQGPNSVVIGEGREFRRLTVRGTPEFETGALRDLASALAAVSIEDEPKFVSGQKDNNALETMKTLLDDPLLGGWMRQIEIAPLLRNFASSFPTAAAQVGPIGNMRTLDDVIRIRGEGSEAFQSYVYNLVFFNAEALSTAAGTMISADTVKKVSDRLGGNIIIQHTQPGPARASLEDRVAAHRLFSLGEQIGHLSDFPLLVANDTELTFFDDIKNVLLTMSAFGQVKETRPSNAPYQSLRLSLQGLADDVVSLLGDLVSSLRGRARPQDRFFAPGDKALANAALRLASALHGQKGLSADQLRSVWGLVQELALGGSKDRMKEVLSGAGLSGLGLEELILQLSEQIRQTQLSPGAMNFAAGGHLMQMGPQIRFFLNVSALPADMEGPEAEWARQRLGEAMDLRLMDPKTAARLAKDLRRKVSRRGNSEEIYQSLLLIAGLYESDFIARLNQKMQSGFTTRAEVEAVLSGKGGNQAAREAALGLLLEPLVKTMVKATGVGMDPQLESLINNVEISVVDPSQMDPRIINRKAGLILDGNRAKLQIGLEPGLDAQEALIETVGRTAHEVAHLFADKALEKLKNGTLGVPTLAEEAWVARTTSIALRWLKLEAIADVIDLQTAEKVASMEESQAFYLTYKNIKGDTALIAKLAARVKADRGNTRIVVLASRREMKAALAELGTVGLHVASSNDVLSIRPGQGETALEAHGRLYLGTRSVKLIADQTVFTSDKDLKALVSLSGKVIPELVALLSPLDYSSRLEQLMQERLKDRLVGRQA